MAADRIGEVVLAALKEYGECSERLAYARAAAICGDIQHGGLPASCCVRALALLARDPGMPVAEVLRRAQLDYVEPAL